MASGERVMVNGVSLYLEGPRFPWQRPERHFLPLKKFFEAAGAGAAYRAPDAETQGGRE